MARRMAIGVVGAMGLLLSACGDDGGDTDRVDATADSATRSTTDPPGEFDVTLEELDGDVFRDLPEAPAEAEADLLPLEGWEGSAVIVGPAGGLIRLGDEQGAEFASTDGIDPGEEGTLVRAVRHVASDGELLVALGREHDLVADVAPSDRPVTWSSTDGETWDRLDTTGFEDSANEVRVSALTADPQGGFIAGGEVQDGDQTVLTLWESDDGETWEVLESPGLDQPEEGDDGEQLGDLAVVDETIVAVRYSEGLDDFSLTIFRGGREEPWERVEDTGLDSLHLPNTDLTAELTTLDDRFVIFGSVAADPDEEFGDRRPALFTSEDGEAWATTVLEGPTLEQFSPLAITATEDGVLALAFTDNEATVWRIAS